VVGRPASSPVESVENLWKDDLIRWIKTLFTAAYQSVDAAAAMAIPSGFCRGPSRSDRNASSAAAVSCAPLIIPSGRLSSRRSGWPDSRSIDAARNQSHQPASRTGGVRAAWVAELFSLSMLASRALLKKSTTENEAMPMVINRH